MNRRLVLLPIVFLLASLPCLGRPRAENILMRAIEAHRHNLHAVRAPGYRKETVELDTHGRAQRCHLFTQGSLARTGRALDIAIQGGGMLVLTGSDGKVVYTRLGRLFYHAGRREIVGAGGRSVLTKEGRGLCTSFADFTISSDGDVRAGPHLVGRISLATFANYSGLHTTDGILFTATAQSGPPVTGRPGDLTLSLGVLAQECLEKTNINFVEESVELAQARARLDLLRLAFDGARALVETSPRCAAVFMENLAELETSGYKQTMLRSAAFDLAQGRLQRDNAPTHLAVVGRGFFVVRVDGRICLTRNGAFRLDPARRMLVGVDGGELRIVSPRGEVKWGLVVPPQANDIVVDRHGFVSTTMRDGQEKPLGRIMLACPVHTGDLSRAGFHGFFSARLRPLPPSSATLVQGALELSNVDLPAHVRTLLREPGSS